MTTYRDVVVGDVLLGHDGRTWGVATLAGDQRRPDCTVVTLVRPGAEPLVGQPPTDTPVTILARGQAAEWYATEVLICAGLGPVEILGQWEK